MVHKKTKEPKVLANENDIFSLAPRILELLQGVRQLELENFSMEIGDLDLFIPSGSLAQALGSSSLHPHAPAKTHGSCSVKRTSPGHSVIPVISGK